MERQTALRVAQGRLARFFHRTQPPGEAFVPNTLKPSQNLSPHARVCVFTYKKHPTRTLSPRAAEQLADVTLDLWRPGLVEGDAIVAAAEDVGAVLHQELHHVLLSWDRGAIIMLSLWLSHSPVHFASQILKKTPTSFFTSSSV